MINISTLQDVRLIKWCENYARHELKLNCFYDPSQVYVFALDDGKDFIGAIVAHNYNPPATIELSVYTLSPKWATRNVIRTVFDYCFNVAKVNRVYTQVCGNNHKSQRITKKFGLTEIAVLPDSIVTLDGNVHNNHIFSMSKSECKWLWQAVENQENQAAA